MTKKTLLFESFGITDIGLVREHNEDIWAAYPEEGLFIVADGMGGHSCGEIAASQAVDYLYTLYRKNGRTPFKTIEDARRFFKQCFAHVNTLVYNNGEREEDLKGMGTTLCMLFIQKDQALIVHVGDSRIYRFRDQRLEQLTVDHSLVSELMATGLVRKGEAENFPYRHVLTRAIGTQPHVEAALSIIEVLPGDRFMLCTDGLTNYASLERMEKIFRTESDLAEQSQSLVDLALRAGGCDNITLLLVAIA